MIDESLRKPNILLIVVDSLRADFVGCCRVPPAANSVTPLLDRFAAEGINFVNCFSQGISSAPSMTSLLTSTWPLDYGGHWYLDSSRITIAEILQAEGYATAAIHSNPNISRLRNFHKGFDLYEENLVPWDVGSIGDHLPARYQRLINRFFRILRLQPYLPAEALNGKVMRWLKQEHRPFFLWIQYMDVHGPYLSHKGFPYYDKFQAERMWRKAVVKTPELVTPEERRRHIASYESEIRHADRQLGALLSWLEQEGILDETLVIVTADHGDEIGEHGFYGHKNNPYDELIHVPLVVKFPATAQPALRQPRTITGHARLIDLVPTVLDLLGLDPEQHAPDQIQGLSLLPLVRGETTGPLFEYVISENMVKNTDSVRVAFRNERWKYIVDGVNQRVELYDLGADPQEQHNCADEYPDVVAHFESRVNEHLAQIRERSGDIVIPDVLESREVLARLEALGYL